MKKNGRKGKMEWEKENGKREEEQGKGEKNGREKERRENNVKRKEKKWAKMEGGKGKREGKGGSKREMGGEKGGERREKGGRGGKKNKRKAGGRAKERPPGAIPHRRRPSHRGRPRTRGARRDRIVTQQRDRRGRPQRRCERGGRRAAAGPPPEEGQRPRAELEPAPAPGGGTWVLPRLHHPAAAAERRSGARRGERLCGPAERSGDPRGRRRGAPHRASRVGVRPRAPPGAAFAARAMRAPKCPPGSSPRAGIGGGGGGETGQKLGVCSCEEACREFSGRKTAPWVREHEAGIRRLFLLELLYEQTGRTARRSAPRRTVGFAVGLLPRGISVAGWKPRCLTTRRSVSTASRQKIIIIIIMKQSKQTKNLLQAC